MSVHVNDRKIHTLEAAQKALELAAYTLKICSNKKRFDTDKYGNIVLLNKIQGLSLDIYTCINTANEIPSRVDSRDFVDNMNCRIELQNEAIKHCNTMFALVNIAFKIFHMNYNRLEYWSRNIKTVKELTQSWRNSEIQKLKNNK